MIRELTNLTYSDQRSHPVSNTPSMNNDTFYLNPVISYICVMHKIICEFCGEIGHKADLFII